MRCPLLCLAALVAALTLAACGQDEEGESGSELSREQPAETTETEPSPAEARDALRDTSVRPDLPRPTGSPPRRLEKEDVVKGRGRAAKAGDEVTVHYAGVSFSTGEEFDASWNSGQPFSFPLGAGQVIEGWDMGVVGMRKGGRRLLTIPPELAYGPEGSPPAIGPNETLVFAVDLLEIQ